MTRMSQISNDELQKKCEAFLEGLGVPGFIVFGWQKGDPALPQLPEFGVVSSFHRIPASAAVKGMTWALNDFASKSL